MIHTFELSKMITSDMFENVRQQLSWDYYKKGFFLTMKYADYGFSAIRLYKFRNDRYEEEKLRYKSQSNEYMYLYMLTITVNVGLMFGKNSYYAKRFYSGSYKKCK